jgi:hypothetical protein
MSFAKITLFIDLDERTTDLVAVCVRSCLLIASYVYFALALLLCHNK